MVASFPGHSQILSEFSPQLRDKIWEWPGNKVASVPGLPPFWSPICVHNNTQNQKIGENYNREGLGAFITWMTSGGHDRGGGAQLPRQRTGPSVRALYRIFELQTLAWWKLLVLTSKKLAFKFSMYIFEYRPLSPYVHLASNSRDECSQAFPVFHQSSAPVWTQTEGKNGGGLGMRLRRWI